MIRVVNNRRKLENRYALNVYIGRPSPLGNPFLMRNEGQRTSAINQYREWLMAKIAEGDKIVCGELDRIIDTGRLKDVNLICWCSPRSCHGDVIKAYVETIMALKENA